MIPIVLETATPQELEELPNVGRKRTQAILALRDEEAITMQRLVAVTNITQVEWARMYRDGLFTSNIPAEELIIPSLPASPRSLQLEKELTAVKGVMEEMVRRSMEVEREKQSGDDRLTLILGEFKLMQQELSDLKALRTPTSTTGAGAASPQGEEDRGSGRQGGLSKTAHGDEKMESRQEYKLPKPTKSPPPPTRTVKAEPGMHEGRAAVPMDDYLQVLINEIPKSMRYREAEPDKGRHPAIKREGTVAPGESKMKYKEPAHAPTIAEGMVPIVKSQRKHKPVVPVGHAKEAGTTSRQRRGRQEDSSEEDNDTSESEGTAYDTEEESEESSGESDEVRENTPVRESTQSRGRTQRAFNAPRIPPRPRSPPPPKMDTFHGSTAKWRSFIFQFKQAARSSQWDDKTK